MTADPQDFYIPERALVIVAHPDDIEFGMAGTVARWTDAGAEVTYCIITNGAAGSNDPDTRLEELIETRRQEQIGSAATVGVTDVRFLNYADGVLQHTLELRRDLTRLIREVRPQVVGTMDPTVVFVQNFYINHPDHRAAAEAAIYAVFPSAGTRPIFPELLAEGLEPHNVSRLYMMLSLNPDLWVDVSTTHSRKLDALRCHASQLNEDAIQMAMKWDSEAGKDHNMPFAEHFRVMRFDQPPGEWESA